MPGLVTTPVIAAVIWKLPCGRCLQCKLRVCRANGYEQPLPFVSSWVTGRHYASGRHRLRYRGCSATGLSDGCLERGSVFRSVGRMICER
jgi:hypothetical protein